MTRIEKQVSYDIGFPTTFRLLDRCRPRRCQSRRPRTSSAQQSVVYDGYSPRRPPAATRFRLTGWGDATMTLDGKPSSTCRGENGWRVVTRPPLNLVAGSGTSAHHLPPTTRSTPRSQPGTLLLQWKTPARALSRRRSARPSPRPRKANVAIVYVRTFEGEQRDRVSLKLPQSADQLDRAVAAANPRTIVVLANAGPVTMPWLSLGRRRRADLLRRPGAGRRAGRRAVRRRQPVRQAAGHLPAQRDRDVPVSEPVDRPRPASTSTTAKGIDVGYKGYQTRRRHTAVPVRLRVVRTRRSHSTRPTARPPPTTLTGRRSMSGSGSPTPAPRPEPTPRRSTSGCHPEPVSRPSGSWPSPASRSTPANPEQSPSGSTAIHRRIRCPTTTPRHTRGRPRQAATASMSATHHRTRQSRPACTSGDPAATSARAVEYSREYVFVVSRGAAHHLGTATATAQITQCSAARGALRARMNLGR